MWAPRAASDAQPHAVERRHPSIENGSNRDWSKERSIGVLGGSKYWSPYVTDKK